MVSYTFKPASSPYYNIRYSSGYQAKDPMHKDAPYLPMPRTDYRNMPGSLATKGSYS